MRTISIVVALLALFVAGCGGSDNQNAQTNTTGAATSTPASNSSSSSSSAGGGGEQIALAAPADGSLKFDKKTLSAKAGKVTINFDNPSGTPHAVEVEGNGVEQKTDTITNGKVSLTADLKPGKYEFYCPVPGHKQAGMKGTLTVS